LKLQLVTLSTFADFLGLTNIWGKCDEKTNWLF